METPEWQVVRYRKSRLLSKRVPSERKPIFARDKDGGSVVLVRFDPTSSSSTSPVKRQEVESFDVEEPDSVSYPETWKASLTRVVGGSCKQKKELFLKLRKAEDKVRQSPFFHCFVEQLQQLPHGLFACSLPPHPCSADGFQEANSTSAAVRNRQTEGCVAHSQTGPQCDALGLPPVFNQRLQLVVYGIGSIQESEVSRCQMSLALLLKELSLASVVSPKVYDPVLTPIECAVLEHLGFTPLEHNENGKMCFAAPTLFYMPHCEAGLYEHVIKSNMPLVMSGQAVILGNSFRSYQDRWSLAFGANKSGRPDLLLEFAEILEEHPVDSRSFPVEAAFNDTSWHYFQPSCEDAGT